MPVLEQEPILYPPTVLDDPVMDAVSASADFERASLDSQWFVAHTKPRQEKALARYLLSCGIPYFAPQYCRENPRRRGVVRSWIPLFTGYVFVRSNEAGRIEALQSNRIVATLRVADQQRLLDDLRRVKRLLDAELPLYPEEKLQAGSRVRIATGTLAGMEGTVVCRHGRHRFVVAVDFIQRGVSVEIDARALEPLPEH